MKKPLGALGGTLGALMPQTQPEPSTHHSVLKTYGCDYRRDLWQLRETILRPPGLTPAEAHAVQRGEQGDLVQGILSLYDCAAARRELTQFDAGVVRALEHGDEHEQCLAMETIVAIYLHRSRRLLVAKDALVQLFQGYVRARNLEETAHLSYVLLCLGIVQATELEVDLRALLRQYGQCASLRARLLQALTMVAPASVMRDLAKEYRTAWQLEFPMNPMSATSTFGWICMGLARQWPHQLLTVAHTCRGRDTTKNQALYQWLGRLTETDGTAQLGRRKRLRLRAHIGDVLDIARQDRTLLPEWFRWLRLWQ